MAYFVDPAASDTFVSCPYNSSHQIKASRLIYHMTRCSGSSRLPERLVCPYNAKHRLMRHEMLEHIGECKSMVPGVISESELDEYKKYVEAAKDQDLVEKDNWEGPASATSSWQEEEEEEEEDWNFDCAKTDNKQSTCPTNTNSETLVVDNVEVINEVESTARAMDNLRHKLEATSLDGPGKHRVNRTRANYRNVVQ